MLDELRAAYPSYGNVSNPFLGLATGEVNCLGAGVAACALDPENLLLRHTVARIVPFSKTILFHHYLAVGRELTITESTNTPLLIGQRPLNDYGQGISPSLEPYAYFEDTKELIAELLVADGLLIGERDAVRGGIVTNLIRVAKLDPLHVLDHLGARGDLSQLRDGILRKAESQE